MCMSHHKVEHSDGGEVLFGSEVNQRSHGQLVVTLCWGVVSHKN